MCEHDFCVKAASLNMTILRSTGGSGLQLHDPFQMLVYMQVYFIMLYYFDECSDAG